MIARKRRSQVETYNDLDHTAYTVFAVLQDTEKREELIRLMENTPTSREQYEVCREVLANPNEHSDVQRAWAFTTCGSVGCWSSLHCEQFYSCRQQHRRLIALPQEIIRWRNRFRHVCLENRPWQEIIEIYDTTDSFFFCDPPYLPGVLRSPEDAYYLHTMTRSTLH